MPFLASARGSFGPQGRFGKKREPFGTGAAGPLSVSTTTSVNSYAYITDASRTTSQNSCTFDTVSGFTTGSVVLIHQTQCASNSSLIGKMQRNVITNISGTTVTFATPFSWNIVSGTANSSSANICQVVTLPQYTTVAVNSGGTIQPGQGWDGTKGGIVAFEATLSTTISSGGTIHANARGFRGGNGGTGMTQGTTGVGGGYSGETATGGGKNYGTLAAGNPGGNQDGATGHVNLHGVTGGSGFSAEAGNSAAGGVGYGAGGGCRYGSGSAGAAGGAGGSLTYDLASYRFTLGAGGGGGGAGVYGNASGGTSGGGAGAGGGLIIIRTPSFNNAGTISARPGYGAGGAGGYNGYVGNHGNYAGGAGGDNGNSGNGQIGAGSQRTQQTAGGAGTGQGGMYSVCTGQVNDRGGMGGFTGLVGGGDGGRGNDVASADGTGGGGAGGSGGGAGAASNDVAAGSGGGAGAAGGIIFLEAESATNTGTIRAPRGLGGAGSGGANGWSNTQAGEGGDAQSNPSSASGYRNNAFGKASTNGGGGGGAAGYVGSLGQVILATTSGSYTGTISTTDNAQSETGININTVVLGSGPFTY